MRRMQAPELATLLKERNDVTLLDVREPWEIEKAALPQATTIPMATVPDRIDELDAHRTTVVMCKLGGRSFKVATYLEQHGFQDVINLDGGIEAWSTDVDATIPQY